MKKEILEQPNALEETFNSILEKSIPISELWKLTDCERVITLARGSSANAANFSQYIFAELANIQAQPQSIEIAIDFESKLDLRNTLAIAVSQSGETRETIAALRWAKQNGAATLAISNNPNSTLEQIADLAISTLAGKEIAVPATKSYSTALLAITLIAAILGENNKALEELKTLPKLAQKVIEKTELTAAVEKLKNAKTMISCGNGFTENIALEVALKFRETCYVDAIGITVAELQHGTKALFEEDENLLIFTNGQSHRSNRELEVIAKRAFGAGVVPIIFGDFPQTDPYTYISSESTWSELSHVFITLIQAQLLVEALATQSGLNPDAPRHLSKITQLESERGS